ncbi:hypothetical protein GUJ93_ZPchr0012g19858 [Zizania palustris]|uniref:Uncharacterized protein n=1 Tax=Zizania palustris TaxID=103762 RepID=A0A8J5WMX5_ZIZPA|nr:hypothetical protein GUJ93_ZPchr0012g19858 [Zizania palustris]
MIENEKLEKSGASSSVAATLVSTLNPCVGEGSWHLVPFAACWLGEIRRRFVVNIGPNEQFLKFGQSPQLTVYPTGHSMQNALAGLR